MTFNYKKYSRAWNLAHPEQYKANMAKFRERNREKLRLQAVEYRKRNKFKTRAYATKYRKEHRTQINAWLKLYRKKPEAFKRYIARKMIAEALRKGVIKKEKCSFGKCKRWGEAHHDNYDKPMEIKWFCKIHHEKLHHI